MQKGNKEHDKDHGSERRKLSRRVAILLILLLLFFILCGMIFAVYIIRDRYFIGDEPSSQSEVVRDISSSELAVSSVSNDDGKNYFSVEVDSMASLKGGVLTTRVVNPKSNYYSCKVDFRLADGTMLYQSDVMKPGQLIESVPLEVKLKRGDYTMEVVYNILDDNGDVKSVQIVEVHLTVG